MYICPWANPRKPFITPQKRPSDLHGRALRCLLNSFVKVTANKMKHCSYIGLLHVLKVKHILKQVPVAWCIVNIFGLVHCCPQ